VFSGKIFFGVLHTKFIFAFFLFLIFHFWHFHSQTATYANSHFNNTKGSMKKNIKKGNNSTSILKMETNEGVFGVYYAN